MSTRDGEAGEPAAEPRAERRGAESDPRELAGPARPLATTSATIPERSAEAMQELLLELQAHQLEVEMQNSQLRSAQAALALSHERYSRLYEQAPVGYLTLSAEGVILEANLTVAQLVGVERCALLNTSWTRYLAPEDQDAYYLQRRAAETTHSAFSCELRLKAQGPGSRWVRMDAKPVPGTSPEGSRWWTTLTETSASRELAEELEHANKMRAVGVLASGVAHEFNNMLAVIVGHAELLQETLAGQTTATEDLAAIIAAARRARDVARQLLAYGRKQVLRPIAVDLRTALPGLTRTLRTHLAAETSLRFELADDVGAPIVDPLQLEQALANLATNARHAMTAGGDVVIRADNAEVSPGTGTGPAALPPGPYVRLRFSDNGSGIPPEAAGRLFEPFFTTKPFGQGTGLGLAIVHGIVSQSGGSISVESEPGKGSTFIILLPRSPEPARPVELSAKERGAPRRFGGSVLLVDDDPRVRAVVKRLLARLGFEVVEAGDGPQALKLFAAEPGRYRCVVTDIAMPGMDGVALAGHLRALHPDQPLLFVTGYLEGAESEGASLAHSRVLQKPFTSDALAAALAALLAPAEVGVS